MTIHWSTVNKKSARKLATFFRAYVELAKLITSHRSVQKIWIQLINKSDLRLNTITQ